MFFAREQGEDIFAVRKPSQQAVEQQKHEHGDHKSVRELARIAKVEYEGLHGRQQRNAEQRPHRAPLARPDIEEGQHKDRQHDEDHPPFFTAESESVHAERGRDAFSPFEFHRYGIDVPDDDRNAADIAGEVGNKYVGSRKNLAAENEISDEKRNAALDHIEKESERADLEPELTAHVHRARIAAPHFAHVFMLDLGNEQREIETADEIGNDRHYNKPVPNILKIQFRHTVLLSSLFSDQNNSSAAAAYKTAIAAQNGVKQSKTSHAATLTTTLNPAPIAIKRRKTAKRKDSAAKIISASPTATKTTGTKFPWRSGTKLKKENSFSSLLCGEIMNSMRTPEGGIMIAKATAKRTAGTIFFNRDTAFFILSSIRPTVPLRLRCGCA